MLFSRIGYEYLVEQFVKNYTASRPNKDKQRLIGETSNRLTDIQYRAMVVMVSVLFTRLYANDLNTLCSNMAKVRLLNVRGVVNRLEALKVVWWCLSDFLDNDASFILDEVERLINCND